VDTAFMLPERNAVELASGPRPGGTSRKPHSGHTGTVSITVRVRAANWSAVKPRIHGVLTQWIPGFMAFRARATPCRG